MTFPFFFRLIQKVLVILKQNRRQFKEKSLAKKFMYRKTESCIKFWKKSKMKKIIFEWLKLGSWYYCKLKKTFKSYSNF